MSRPGELALLARQLLAHHAWALRRAMAEAAAWPLVRLSPLSPVAGRIALRLHPGSPAAHEGLARGAERRGDLERAREHRESALHAARNTLETSVLDAVRGVFARRRSGASSADPAAPSSGTPSLDADAARAALASGSAATGRRIDALLALSRDVTDPSERIGMLQQAVDLDAGRADAWRELGRARSASGRDAEAIRSFERALDLDPLDIDAWLALARSLGATPEAGRALGRALALDPERDDVLRALHACEDRAPDEEARAEVTVEPESVALAVGARTRLRVSVELSTPGTLYVLPPAEGGLLCLSAERVALDAGAHEVEVEIEGRRPASATRDGAWPLGFAVACGSALHRDRCAVHVDDVEPGRLQYIVTEDHEIYDERERTSAAEARTTLVDKSRLAERLANEAGARWTHVVDVGSLALVEWAADRDPDGDWPDVAAACREHLIDAVETGNDLGLHCHGFHDPESDVFAHGFDHATGEVTTDPELLDRPGRERGFWSRAYPRLGDVDDRGSRAWATWRGIGRLESLGRLADPRFRVALFRAGSFDFGDDAAERSRSLSLLHRLGLLADSNVPKPRLYVRPVSPATYPVEDDPFRPAETPALMRALELRAEYNVESDFLSDRGVLDRYLARRVESCRDDSGAIRPGVHVICSMTHDKFINWRMGRDWDSLDPGYGDWVTIREHLGNAAASHGDLEFVRARDTVLEWYDRCSPRLVAWRDEEFAVVGEASTQEDEFVYSIRLLGRGIPASADRPRRVRVHWPAWCHGRIEDAWIERDGRRWPSRSPQGAPCLEFDVDSREARFELRVRVSGGGGIRIADSGGEALSVESALPYRRASVELPANLAGGGDAVRIRGVRLVGGDGRYRADIDPSETASS